MDVNAADYIPIGYENAKTRDELVAMTGLTDRKVREDLRIASLHGDLIINLQDGKGYFKPHPNKEDHLVKQWLNMAKSRRKEENRKIRMAERYLDE